MLILRRPGKLYAGADLKNNFIISSYYPSIGVWMNKEQHKRRVQCTNYCDKGPGFGTPVQPFPSKPERRGHRSF
jgi:hypothetical protein